MTTMTTSIVDSFVCLRDSVSLSPPPHPPFCFGSIYLSFKTDPEAKLIISSLPVVIVVASCEAYFAFCNTPDKNSRLKKLRS